MIEEDSVFACPYCGTEQTVRLEPGAGAKQEFVTDCEICCRPIVIRAIFDGDELTDFSADPEQD